MKRCAACKQTLPVEQFDRMARAKDGRQGHCRVCRVAYTREWKTASPKGRATADRTRGSIRKRGIPLCSEHPECASISREGVLARSDGTCGICGYRLRKRWHMDHILPVVRGGIHCYSNLQPAHVGCNLLKSDMTMEEYLAQQH